MSLWPCPLGTDALFSEADAHSRGSVSQAEASGVWARVLLDGPADKQAFNTIWRRVAPADGGGLSRDAFARFLRLCALVQAGHPLTESNMASVLDARRLVNLPSPLPPPIPRLRGGVPAASSHKHHGGPPPGELSAPRAFAARGNDEYADTSSDDEPSWTRAREAAAGQQRKERGGSATNPLFEIQAAATREGSSGVFQKRT